MATATTISPRETKNLDGYGLPPLEWERLIAGLDKTRELPVSDGASQVVCEGTAAYGEAQSGGRPVEDLHEAPWPLTVLSSMFMFETSTSGWPGAVRLVTASARSLACLARASDTRF